MPGVLRATARWLLAGILAFAGVGHLVDAEECLAQVPPWLPDPEAIVAVSGVIEIALAAGLIALPGRRTQIGWLVAGFFIAVFPGNVSQFITQTDAFGLDSELSRGIRLLFQPALVTRDVSTGNAPGPPSEHVNKLNTFVRHVRYSPFS